MSSSGRTKGARSKQHTGFDNTIVMTAGQAIHTHEDKALSNVMKKIIAKASDNVEEKYEIPTSVPQRTIILDGLERVLLELLPARAWEYRKWWCFLWCSMSALLGAFGCLWAMGATVLFAHQKPSMTRLGACCVLFLPAFVWFKVVFFPHGGVKVALDEMTELRRVRRWEAKQRYLHLEGRLPRPETEVEIKDAPYEYQPDEPWMYIRWKPKPKKYYYIDDENVCHLAPHGSEEEKIEIKKEKEITEMLANHAPLRLQNEVKKTTMEVTMDALAAAAAAEQENNGNALEEGRMSSIQTDEGRMSSAA